MGQRHVEQPRGVEQLDGAFLLSKPYRAIDLEQAIATLRLSTK
jgi:hypothetical protein